MTKNNINVFYINPKTKIEILPSDLLNQYTDVIVPKDRLISVFRIVDDNPFAANFINKDFIKEFKANYLNLKLTIDKALIETLRAFNFSLLNFLGEPHLAPKSGVMALIVYINPDNKMTFAQVGPITLKHEEKGKFITLTEDHTFDDKVEVDNLTNSKFFKELGDKCDINQIKYSIATDIFHMEKPKTKYKQIPSRFLGHPNCCGFGGKFGETFINTKPFVSSYQL